jgi:hypothetical protein
MLKRQKIQLQGVLSLWKGLSRYRIEGDQAQIGKLLEIGRGKIENDFHRRSL